LHDQQQGRGVAAQQAQIAETDHRHSLGGLAADDTGAE
jgi:hypothetical protein